MVAKSFYKLIRFDRLQTTEFQNIFLEILA